MSEKSWTKRGPEKSAVLDIYDIITIVYVSILRINHAQNIHYHKNYGVCFSWICIWIKSVAFSIHRYISRTANMQNMICLLNKNPWLSPEDLELMSIATWYLCFSFYVIDKNDIQHGGHTITTGKCQQKCRDVAVGRKTGLLLNVTC